MRLCRFRFEARTVGVLMVWHVACLWTRTGRLMTSTPTSPALIWSRSSSRRWARVVRIGHFCSGWNKTWPSLFRLAGLCCQIISNPFVTAINVKKLFSLKRSVRALNHTSKTAQIILASTLDRTHYYKICLRNIKWQSIHYTNHFDIQANSLFKWQ